MDSLDQRLTAIEERNRRVETDKTWELSVTRRGFIALTTYATACVFLWLIDAADPFLHALVPTGGYLFSTLSLPWIRRWWQGRRQQ